MKIRYRCEGCGCSLDAGEGRICEECRVEEEEKERVWKRMRECMSLDETGQYQMQFGGQL